MVSPRVALSLVVIVALVAAVVFCVPFISRQQMLVAREMHRKRIDRGAL
jgi:hypothetical protein